MDKKRQGRTAFAVLAALFLLAAASRPWEEGTKSAGLSTGGTMAGSEEAEPGGAGPEETEAELSAEPQPEAEAEETGVAQATETSPLLGEGIESHTLQVNGTVLRLPCSIRELEATGFLLCREDREKIEGKNGKEGGYWGTFEDGRGNYLKTVVATTEQKVKNIEEFLVIEIEATVVFPGGIQIGGSMGEDVLAQYSPPDMIVHGDINWENEREDMDVRYHWFDDYYDYNDGLIITDKEGLVDRMLLSYGGKQERMKKEFAEMVLGRWSPYPESGEKSLHTVEFRRYPDVGPGNPPPYVEYVDESGTYYGYNTYEVVDDTTIRAVFDSFLTTEGEFRWQSEPEKGFSATFTYDEESMELKAEYHGNMPEIKKEERTLYKIKTTDIWW